MKYPWRDPTGTTPRQIIVMGCGGFSMEPRNLRLDRYILAQARPHAKAYRVELLKGKVVEEPLPTDYLLAVKQ